MVRNRDRFSIRHFSLFLKFRRAIVPLRAIGYNAGTTTRMKP
jgi:hypothetical protein